MITKTTLKAIQDFFLREYEEKIDMESLSEDLTASGFISLGYTEVDGPRGEEMGVQATIRESSPTQITISVASDASNQTWNFDKEEDVVEFLEGTSFDELMSFY